MQTSMQNEKESQQEAEKECLQKIAKLDLLQKTLNKQPKQPSIAELLKSVGDCVLQKTVDYQEQAFLDTTNLNAHPATQKNLMS